MLNIKYLCINLIYICLIYMQRNIKHWFKNHRRSKQMEKHTMLMEWEVPDCWNVNSFQFLYGFHTISIKILACFFFCIFGNRKKLILKFTWEFKGSRTEKKDSEQQKCWITYVTQLQFLPISRFMSTIPQ